ncbi:MAG: 2-deoxy-5-keto-D-gluconate 6-phosphate aldolase domain-containing protein [Thermoproteota archaeon]
MSKIDYTKKELLILAFDHRSSFVEKLFGIKGRAPTPKEKEQICSYKRNIFEGFKLAISRGVPKNIAGLLVDEEFGASIAREARSKGFNLAMPVEKSGQDEFDFEYGENFRQHIEDFDPTYTKVLVRYNPEGDREVNRRQLSRLKVLSDYLHSKNRPFLFELLVPPTKEQLAKVGESKEEYDTEVRPKLMVIAMDEIQKAGVEPDIWKLEGTEKGSDARAVVKQAQAGGRKAGVITLGRGESKELVQKWLKTGAKIEGIIGFAVGRTIFWDPLVELKAGKIGQDEAIERIAQNYMEFANLWINERNG